jgi:hypothetical protein
VPDLRTPRLADRRHITTRREIGVRRGKDVRIGA